jgi:hypothetical protein
MILDWYDGYSWDAKTKVFNPWSILNFFNYKMFSDYWYGKSSPTLIQKLLGKHHKGFFDMPGDATISISLNTVAYDDLEPAVLMFQSGYLTIKEEILKGSSSEFTLTYPN